MATAADQIAISLPAVSSAPSDYVVPGSQEIELQTVTATFDGTGAGGAFLPALQIISDAGILLATFIDTSVSVAAGGSAEVTFGTFLRRATPSTTTVVIGTVWGLAAWQSGCYYAPQWQTWNGSTFTAGSDNFIVYPIWIPTGATVADISFYVYTPFGGQTIRGGIYKDNGSGYPAGLVVDTGHFSPGAGGVYDIPITHITTAGLYWLGGGQAGGTLTIAAFGGPTGAGPNIATQTVASTNTLADAVTGQGFSNYSAGVQTGALPDPFPAGKHPHTLGAGPGVWVKTA